MFAFTPVGICAILATIGASIATLNLISYAILALRRGLGTAMILGMANSKSDRIKHDEESDLSRVARQQWLLIAGYVYALFALVALPPVFGLIAIVLGVKNRKAGFPQHGKRQILLGISCAIAGLIIGVCAVAIAA
ncbi:MAG: hypothetical protein QM796_13210 [Chthoniobacteraceae bacterium]